MGVQPQSRRRAVGLILTGGTIAAAHGSDSVLSVAGDSTHDLEIALLTRAAGGEDLEVEVRSPVRLLSENLEPTDWVPIAEAVKELAEMENLTGIVIFHGTDTMAYTAAALSYLLVDLDKPVVLTGSNLPPNQDGSDAVRNAHVSLVAIDSLEPGTYIAFAGDADLPGLVHLGTRVRKLQASGQAYASVNGGPVGRVIDRRFQPGPGVVPSRVAHPAYSCRIDPRVLTLRLYPGLNLETAFEAVVRGGVRGVVVELYASATGPDTGDAYSLPDFIRRCGQHGVPVLTTVSIAPSETGNAYETTVAIAEAGGVFLEKMLPETATVKLMWALAQDERPEVVKTLMATPLAGDMPPAAERVG